MNCALDKVRQVRKFSFVAIALRRYFDTESSDTFTADDLDKLLEQEQH